MTTVFTIMGYGGMALAVICLVLAVVLFIRWDIPKVIGDITGHTERKTIERIRNEGYEVNRSKKSILQPAAVTGKIKVRKTETTPLSSKKHGYEKKSGISSGGTGADRESAVARDGMETNTVLHINAFDEETTMLDISLSGKEETVVLDNRLSDGEETAVLDDADSGRAETSVLSTSNEQPEVLPGYTFADGIEITASGHDVEKINGGGDMRESEEATTVLSENSVEGVIQLQDEIITQPGTVVKVLDFVIVHTDHSIA